MRYFVKVNGNKIPCFGYADALKIAAKTGGKLISVPVSR